MDKDKKIIFDGSNLRVSDEHGIIYDKNRSMTLEDANRKFSGGKKYNSLDEHFEDFRSKLRKFK